MKHLISTLLAASLALVAGAVPFRPVGLPAVERLDAEVTTNVSVAAWQRRAAKFSFSLSCLATPSNNVEAAFGTDVDGDGALSARETALVVGWDCGAWFVRKGVDGHCTAVEPSSTNEVKTLAWNYRLTASEASVRLSALADGEPVFAPETRERRVLDRIASIHERVREYLLRYVDTLYDPWDEISTDLIFELCRTVNQYRVDNYYFDDMTARRIRTEA